MRLGHRVGLLAARSLRSLKLNRPSKLIKIKAAAASPSRPPPRLELPPLASLDSSRVDQEDFGSGEPHAKTTMAAIELAEKEFLDRGEPVAASGLKNSARAERKRRRLARAAERRALRLKRTMGLVRRLREGKLYSDLLPKVSDKIQARARRASHAIVSHFTGGGGAAVVHAEAPARARTQADDEGSARHRAANDEMRPQQQQLRQLRRRRARQSDAPVVRQSARVAPAALTTPESWSTGDFWPKRLT